LLKETAAEHGMSMKDLTVLSDQVDPFRLDTPANHRDGRWLADAAQTLGLLTGERKIHLRGLHYAISMAKTPFFKPDGARYVNDQENWLWLSETAAKAARWLGHIDFDRIFDKRNAAPIVRRFERTEPWPYLSVGVDVEIPDAADIEPAVNVLGFFGAQPYKIVMIGEKASLEEGLAPVAESVEADLYLPTGNISDTLVHQIAQIGAEDGRPMVVLYFSDCDPSGWNMPIEVGRKLQAFRANLFPELEFRCFRALLTPDQARTFGLPSSPLKPTEARAGKWRDAMGVEQTEVDALTTPEMLPTLRRLARAAVAPFYDRTLARRVSEARVEWVRQAQEVVDNSIDQEHLDRLRVDAEARLGELRSEIDAINDALRLDISDFDVLPVPDVPEPVLDGGQPLPLLDSAWSFADQCRRLKASKRYEDGAP
jgi:hypothetical protein